MNLRKLHTNMGSVFETVHDRIKTFTTSDHHLVFDIPNILPLVVADGDRLQRIITLVLGDMIRLNDHGNICVLARNDRKHLVVSLQSGEISQAAKRISVNEFLHMPESNPFCLDFLLLRRVISEMGGEVWLIYDSLTQTFCWNFWLQVVD